jgi:hypothetical protein
MCAESLLRSSNPNNKNLLLSCLLVLWVRVIILSFTEKLPKRCTDEAAEHWIDNGSTSPRAAPAAAEEQEAARRHPLPEESSTHFF